MDVNKGPTGRIRDLRAVVAGVTREDVVGVLRNFNLAAAEVYGFGDSTNFDLVHEGRRLPPMAVFGLAAKRSIGRVLLPEEFSGGSQSPCFHVLRDLGFVIEPKAPGAVAATPNFQVPDDWLLQDRRALLFGREVLKAVMAAFTPGSQAT